MTIIITSLLLQIHNSIANEREIPIGTEIRVPIDWLAIGRRIGVAFITGKR
jgi:hypothetical protein